MASEYVHGYSSAEGVRLADQAPTLTELLHSDTFYPPGSLVLEAGCGVGAQTVVPTQRSPGARIVSVEISPESLTAARERVRAASLMDRTSWNRGIRDLHRTAEPDGTFWYTFFRAVGVK
jgi:cyclopropane fatty-acyl-phospholipid synthase-like methyltransferase